MILKMDILDRLLLIVYKNYVLFLLLEKRERLRYNIAAIEGVVYMITLGECLTDDTKIYLVPIVIETRSYPFLLLPKPGFIYRKDFNHAEFVGEELCEIRKLKCAHYFLIGETGSPTQRLVRYGDVSQRGYQIKLGSYDFKKAGYEYFDLNSFCTARGDYPNRLEKILGMAPNQKNRMELLEEIEEMFALDIYMGQTDRIPSNIMFQRNILTREIHLAPLFDFQYSLKLGYLLEKNIYDNSLFSMEDMESIKNFLKDHPEFFEKLESYLKVDLAEVVRSSYYGRGLKVPEEKYPYFREFDKNRKELIKTILH